MNLRNSSLTATVRATSSPCQRCAAARPPMSSDVVRNGLRNAGSLRCRPASELSSDRGVRRVADDTCTREELGPMPKKDYRLAVDRRTRSAGLLAVAAVLGIPSCQSDRRQQLPVRLTRCRWCTICGLGQRVAIRVS